MADIAMTGEAGANRTFRSIFGDQEKRPDEAFELEREQNDNSEFVHSSQAMDDDDEAMWGDDPPLVIDGDAMDQDNNDMPGLQFAERKSMEEWAEEDDEEENWKEALQDRVNQLELAFQHNNDATAADSRRRFEQQQQVQHIDFSQSLPASAWPNSSSDRLRQASRHKMQRTSSSHACITESSVQAAAGRPSHLWSFQRKVGEGTTPASTTPHDARKRSTRTDFVTRNIQTVEQHRKRSGSLSGASSRTDSPRNSFTRKIPLDSNRSSLSRSSSSNSLRVNKAAASAGSTSSGGAVCNLSDTEAIRRFVLDDVKTMSMERLVGDAQRLQFLEGFYRNHHAPAPGPLFTTLTAPVLSSPPSSPATSLS